MSDNQQKDVLIAVYMFEDLAKRDFDAVMKLAEEKTITVEGVVVVQKDADGEVHVTETVDHLGRRGVKVGGGVGLVVGLFAPPLLAATAVGAAGRVYGVLFSPDFNGAMATTVVRHAAGASYSLLPTGVFH